MSVDVGKAVGYLDLDTSGFRKGFKSAYDDLKTFKDESATLADKMSATGQAMTTVGSSLTKWVTVPLVGAGTAAVTMAGSFESAMSEVKAISGATGEEVVKLSDKAKEMGASTKFSARESAEAMKYMAMAGWGTQQMLDGLPGVMLLAASSGEDLATVSDIVTDSMTAFGLEAKDAAHYSDVLAQASAKSNTSVGLMGETFKYVAPVAGALGYSVEDCAVAIGLMANRGIKAGQAGTQLRALLSRMAKPTDQVAAAMDDLSVGLTDANGEMLPFNELVKNLRESFKDLTPEQKAQYAATLAGQEGMSGLLAIVNAGEGEFDSLTQSINNADGAAQGMADTMMDNFFGQLTILKSTVEGIAISFGELMLPAIKKVTTTVQGAADWLNNLSEGQKDIILKIAMFIAAVGPVLLIVGKLFKSFSTFLFLANSTKTILAGVQLSFSGLLLPLAGVIAAIVALKIAWDNNLGGIRDVTAQIFGILRGWFIQAQTFVTNFLAAVKYMWESNWMGIQDIFAAVWNNIDIILRTAFDVIKELFNLFIAIFKGDWESAWDAVKNIFGSVWDGIIALLGNMLNIIVDTIIRCTVRFLKAGKEAFQGIYQGFLEKWADIKAWFSGVINDPVGTVMSIKDSLFNSGKDIFTSLWDGLKNIWDGLMSWVSECVDWIASKVQFWKDESAKVNNGSGSKSKGSHAGGLDYVPYDGYVATLHRGEAVITQEQNKKRNAPEGNTFVFQSPEPIDEVRAAHEFKKVQRELAEGIN